tara:strand:+ start:454 stop:990 length:537 start_codon:yes stop_codon:yes gene_type:complete
MTSLNTYLPVLYPSPQGKLIVFLKGKELHLVLITNAGDLYRHIMDAQDFKEDVGYAFNEQFPAIFLNALKDLRMELEKEATIKVILAKREVTITLKQIDRSESITMIGLEGITNKIPDLPVAAPMGPPPTPPQLPKPKPKRKRANASHVVAYKRKRKSTHRQVRNVLEDLVLKVIKAN